MIKSNTCLAVLRDKKGKLWFAGDRRQSWGFHKAQVCPRPKVTYRNNVLFAGTGSSSICDLITDQFPAPKYTNQKDTYKYMFGKFIPNLIKWLEKEHWVEKGKRSLTMGRDEELGAVILVGIGSDLYELDINCEGICSVPIDTPYAHGCGGAYALGSLLTTDKLKYNESERLEIALKVAAQVSPGCDDKIDIIHN